MRLVLASMCLMLAVPRAEACPRGAICAVTETRTETGPEVAGRPRPEAPRRAISSLDLAIRGDVGAHDMLARSLRTHVVPVAPTIEMPWMWQVLRDGVYARLPRYERLDLPKDQRVSFVLSPVVVATLQDTVPGLGVQGGF